MALSGVQVGDYMCKKVEGVVVCVYVLHDKKLWDSNTTYIYIDLSDQLVRKITIMLQTQIRGPHKYKKYSNRRRPK